MNLSIWGDFQIYISVPLMKNGINKVQKNIAREELLILKCLQDNLGFLSFLFDFIRIIILQYSGDILRIFLKQKFVECSTNILEILLCDQWNLPKRSIFVIVKRKNNFYIENFLKIFSFKMFPGSPEHCKVERMLNQYSRNIVYRLGRTVCKEDIC